MTVCAICCITALLICAKASYSQRYHHRRMGQDPCSGNVYIFINRARDRIKLLHWEPGGMVLYSKLLEAGTLGKPDSVNDNEVCANIEWRELVMIVEGIMEPATPVARDLKTCRNFENSAVFLLCLLLYVIGF